MSILGHFVELPEFESRLVAFYLNKAPDNAGRILSYIMSWDYEKLEDIHDYIQWLFPLPEESMFSGAPLVDENVFNAFHAFNSSPELQSNLKSSLIKMLDFYGFKFADDLDKNDLPVIIKSSNFYERCSNWLIRRDHNHLRISRILRSLRVLGLESEAAAFYKALSDIIYNDHSQIVSSQSAEFWRRAAERPLHWAPHLNENECANDKQWKIGLDFLKEYERLNMARDLQKQHDEKKALEEKKEAEFQATKAHIAAITADRKRKISGEVETVPKKRASISQESKGQDSEPQSSENAAVVADARETIPELQDFVQDEAPNGPKPYESEFIKPELFALAVLEPGLLETRFAEPELAEPKFGQPELENPRLKLDKPAGGSTEQKSSERAGQSAIHQIQQYQLMSPRQP